MTGDGNRLETLTVGAKREWGLTPYLHVVFTALFHRLETP